MKSNNPQLVTDTDNRLIVNGLSVRVKVLETEQTIRLGFDAKANQRLGLGISDVCFEQNPSSFILDVFAPDGSFLDTTAFGAHGADLELILPQTDGLYVIIVGSQRTTTGSLVLTLSENVSGAISIDGAPADVSLSRPGQNAELTFDARVDQWLAVGISNVRVDSGEGPGFVIDVHAPDGSLLNTTAVGRNSDGVTEVARVGRSALSALIIAPNGSIVTGIVFPLPRPCNPPDPPDRDSFSIEPWPVPVDGDYTLLFEAPRQAAVSFKVTLT